MAFSYRREHAGEDLEAEVLLVSKAVRSALDDPDLAVVLPDLDLATANASRFFPVG